jgi:hypothetical protein
VKRSSIGSTTGLLASRSFFDHKIFQQLSTITMTMSMMKLYLSLVAVALSTLQGSGFVPLSHKIHGVVFNTELYSGKPKIAENILELVGHTPMLKLKTVTEGCGAEIIAKLESNNPANSVKDRIAMSMINEAEARGDISPGKTTLVEPTSGNTGKEVA